MISTTSFAEYATGTRRRRTEIVTGHQSSEKVPFYPPFLDAIRRAATAEDPAVPLDDAIAAADLSGQERAFTELRDGFLTWWHRAKAVPLRSRTTVLRVADLDVAVDPHLAIHSKHGSQVVVFHLKEQELTRDAANASLRVLQICMDDLLPGATPLVVDLRRSREFRLLHNTNRTHVDAWLTAEAAAFTTHLTSVPEPRRTLD